MSDFFVEDGGYFRIQNIQLAYTVKNISTLGIKLPETKIRLTADRPLTLFKYNGFNPEVPDGRDNRTSPTPATYTLGVTIKI